MGLVVLTELFYRRWPVAGFDRPFTPGHNFGAWLDTVLFGTASAEGLVTFNIVPASTSSSWAFSPRGCSRADGRSRKMLVGLVGTGLAGVALGLTLDQVTPVVRKLHTSSFVILNRRPGLLVAALGYWLIDVMRFRKRSVYSSSSSG